MDRLLKMSKYTQLHAQNVEFGASTSGVSRYYPKAIANLNRLGFCESVLDYGCGKGVLVRKLKSDFPQLQIDGYDPAVQEWSNRPQHNRYDIVSCLDVLEHIEPEEIQEVLDDVCGFISKIGFFSIDLQPAGVNLPGTNRNAHVLLAPPQWWIHEFTRRFLSISSIPAYHSTGKIQKIFIFVAKKRLFMPILHYFMHEVNLWTFTSDGGPLGSGQYPKLR